LPKTGKPSAADNLRKQMSDIEDHQAALITERDEISYLALVDRDKKAVERLNIINDELRTQNMRVETMQAALREAVKREVVAGEAERADRRRANAAAAADVLLHAEDTAALLTRAMADLRSHALMLQSQFAEIRKLIDAGPSDQLLRINLARALKAATMGSPMQLEHLAPSERVPVDAAIETWAASIRNRINAVTGEKPARAA
jgi:hypothetical protein